MLESLCLMPPKLGQVRRGIAPASTQTRISRRSVAIQPSGPDRSSTDQPVPGRIDASPVSLPTPLFWDTPPWHTLSAMVARCVCEAVESRGILVSALRSELGLEPSLGDSETAFSKRSRSNSRMLPYRNERYGLHREDWDEASVVDVRLSPPRGVSGRIAYSTEQIGRWEATAEDQPLSGGGWVPAMTLPPDVPTTDRIAAKLDQIRVLCPQAAVIISVTPEWIDECASDLVAARPDAILVRLGQMRMTGLELAHFTLRLSQKFTTDDRLPVWLTPPRSFERRPWSVADCVKMIALGATAVAVDSWMETVVEQLDEIPPPSSFDANPRAKVMAGIEDILQRELDPKIEHFEGLYSTLVDDQPNRLLGTFDPEMARILGLRCIGRFDGARQDVLHDTYPAGRGVT